jgi:hypothetical protein
LSGSTEIRRSWRTTSIVLASTATATLVLGLLSVGPRDAISGTTVGRRASGRADTLSYLDDGVIKVGVDRGGAIAYLSPSLKGGNVVDASSSGRLVQSSYYGGPQPFGQPKTPWQNMPWNPVAAGDRYGNAGRVLVQTDDGRTIYTKSVPLQWALDDVPCKCTFESWVSLAGPVVHVFNRLLNRRSDRRQYPALPQELPATYAVPSLPRLVTYSGSAPFTKRALTEIANGCAPVRPFGASEHWAAIVNDRGWGLGVVNLATWRMVGGVFCAGATSGGAPGSNPIETSYLAPTEHEILDHNIRYTYAYDLVLGSVPEIRAYATARMRTSAPDYRFWHDRQHWWYRDATDSGWPIRGGLRVRLGPRAQLIGPKQLWQAHAAPRIYVRGAFRTRGSVAHLLWSIPNQGLSGGRRAAFSVVPDGRMRSYRIDLAAAKNYSGPITGLGLEPPKAGSGRRFVEIACISSTPC